MDLPKPSIIKSKPAKTLLPTILQVLLFALPISVLGGTVNILTPNFPLYGSDLILLLCLCIGIICYAPALKLVWPKIPRWLLISWLLLCLSFLIGTWISVDRLGALNALKSWLFLPSSLLFLVYLIEAGSAKINLKSQLIIPLVSGLIVAAMLQFGFGIFGLLNDWYPNGRLAGTYNTANALSMATVPVITIVSLFAINQHQNRKLQISLGIIGILLLVSLLLSGSLGGFFSIGIFGLAAFVWSIKANQTVSKKLNYLIIPVLIGLVIVGGLIGKSRYNNPDQNSAVARTQIWNVAFHEIVDHPLLGIGIRSFESSYSQRIYELYPVNQIVEQSALSAHNLLLETWLELGMIGLIALTILLFIVIKQLLLKPELRIWSLAWLSFLCLGIFDIPLFRIELMVLFWIYIAISLAATQFIKIKPD